MTTENPKPATTNSAPASSQESPYMTPEQAGWFSDIFGRLVAGVDDVLLGKTFVIRLSFTALISEGHLLLEDFPGTGKTSLARAIAQSVKGTSSRIQFTPDLLPGDITGVSIYDQKSSGFEFFQGPVFANIVLADEINRASPKTQSALLEVMEEGVVTIDGEGHSVGAPFLVIATQNPVEQAGTYKLPEAQLDRFLIKTSLGYPDTKTAVALLMDSGTRARASLVSPIIKPESIVAMAALATEVFVDESVMQYLSDIVDATRKNKDVNLGVSMRGAMALSRAIKTWAITQGRTYATPDDVRDLATHVLAHRLVLDPESEFAGVKQGDIIERILVDIEPPAYRAA